MPEVCTSLTTWLFGGLIKSSKEIVIYSLEVRKWFLLRNIVQELNR